MMLGTFPTFLTFLTTEATSSGSWQRPLAGPGNFFLPSPRARPAAGLRSRWRQPGDFE